MKNKVLVFILTHGAAIAASALAVANTDLNRVENYVLAVGPTFVASVFNTVRAYLKRA